MIRRPPRSTQSRSSAASDVYKRQARRCGGAFVLDALFARLGIGEALRQAAEGRRLDAEAVERICFALVAQRALEPGSKLAATRWVAERVAIEHCPRFDADAAYAAMDFLSGALPEIAEGVFASTANLLNLACDVIFVDTSSTYFEIDLLVGEVDLEVGRAGVHEDHVAGQVEEVGRAREDSLGDLGEGAGKEVHGRRGGALVAARAVLDGDALGHPARGDELRARLQGALRDKREADAFHYVSVEAATFCGRAQSFADAEAWEQRIEHEGAAVPTRIDDLDVKTRAGRDSVRRVEVA